jgi:NADH:ubiquinone oxidoreductase subunit E
MLGIRPGETTHDGKFTLYYTNCLGACHEGPAMLINDDPYTNLTPEKVKDILVSYMKR